MVRVKCQKPETTTMSENESTMEVTSDRREGADRDDSGDGDFEKIEMEPAGEASKDLLGEATCRFAPSAMERESARERLRLALLKQCSAILKQGDHHYSKESLHKTFQDAVRSLSTFKCTAIYLNFLQNIAYFKRVQPPSIGNEP